MKTGGPHCKGGMSLKLVPPAIALPVTPGQSRSCLGRDRIPWTVSLKHAFHLWVPRKIRLHLILEFIKLKAAALSECRIRNHGFKNRRLWTIFPNHKIISILQPSSS